ncbi:MAG: hypothetical protein AAFU79_25670 [Myxococcota bacterium]
MFARASAWDFLSGLGILFSVGFVVLTATWAYLVLRLRERAHEAEAEALSSWGRYSPDPASGGPEPERAEWSRLAELRAGLGADLERAGIVSGSVPVLALLGTVLGFFFALGSTSQAGLGTADPTAILELMLDSGMATALATTVAGQALYLLMGLAHAAFVSGPVERADVLLAERLERERTP